jgi:hypothetical protein
MDLIDREEITPSDLTLPVHEQQGPLALAYCNSYLEAY